MSIKVFEMRVYFDVVSLKYYLYLHFDNETFIKYEITKELYDIFQ